MKGANAKAEELNNQLEDSIILQQFANQANVEIHQRTTAEEIWSDTDGKVDIIISGVGTGGTVTGISSVLKKRNPKLKVIAVEPKDSAILSGGEAGPHKIQGIGAGFVPDILDTSLIDEIFPVSNEDAVNVSRQMMKSEGIMGGISSGAAAYAALEVAKRPENKDKVIIFILPSCGERYLSTILFDGIEA